MAQNVALDDLTLADGELFHNRKGEACPLPAPLAPLADTHGHLTSFRAHDPAMAIARAALAGVRLLVNRMVDGELDGRLIDVDLSTTTTTTTTGAFLAVCIGSEWAGGYENSGTFEKPATGLQIEVGSTATAYEPPNVTEVALPEADPLMDGDALTVAQDGSVTLSRADGTAEQLGTVQLPQLPAPTFNVYATGGYVPPDTGVEYERDVNIAYEQLEAKIAALTVAQATS